jgi:hypothetical protein
MANYDFKTLLSYDFEILIRDLLQKEMGLRLESFKAGRDNGIDLRYTTDKGNQVVIQCKHYASSTYNALVNNLRGEVSKVNKLSPKRYIIVTSLGLTPSNKEEITTMFSPYILSTGDVFGRDDINNLVTKQPETERQHFKLWLTSSTVLDMVLNGSIYNFSRYEQATIIRKCKLYVQNESFDQAVELLEKYSYCIISGNPGVGKTTLAEMLILYHLKHDFEVIKVSQDTSEAWQQYNPEKYQLFYYDDFLGQTGIILGRLNKNEDDRLVRFIQCVQTSQKTKLILTTREYILQQAQQESEKIKNQLINTSKCIIDLNQYSQFNKAQILFNHLVLSDLPQQYLEMVVVGKHYRKVINHKHYNPRIIEWMSSTAITRHLEPEKYIETFLGNLDNPLGIWEHAFERHLSQAAKNLLLVFGSMPMLIGYESLEKAFFRFHKCQSMKYNFACSYSDYRDALKETMGSFLKTDNHCGQTIIKFQNPSVNDFIENYLRKNLSINRDLITSIEYFEQYETLQWLFRGLPQEWQSVLSENGDVILNELLAKSTEGSCRVSNPYFNQSANCIKRINLILKQFSLFAAYGVNVNNCLSKVVEILVEEISEYSVDKRELILVISQLHVMVTPEMIPIYTNYNNLLVLVKKCFLESLEDIVDFKVAAGLLEGFAELFTEEDKSELECSFDDFYLHDVQSKIEEETNPDNLIEYTEWLESISDILKVPIYGALEELNDRYNVLTNGHEGEENFSYDRVDASNKLDSEEYLLQSRIDNLFEGLLAKNK